MTTKTHHGKSSLYYLRKRLALLSRITGQVHITAYTKTIEPSERARQYAVKHGLTK